MSEETSSRLSAISQMFLKNVDEIDRAAQKETVCSGLTTGLKDLDWATTGLQRSTLTVIASRPSMGKSSLALNIARNAAVTEGASVLLFSPEMSKLELGTRLIAMESGISIRTLRNGKMTRQDWDDVDNALDTLGRTSITVNDSAMISVAEIKNDCKKIRKEKGLDLVIIDSLQMLIPARLSGEPCNDIADLCIDLKKIAKIMDCPVLVTAQIDSGKTDGRLDKRPMLMDLSEHPSIEGAADVILFLYREDFYAGFPVPDDIVPGKSEVIVAKQRNGKTGFITVNFDDQICKFADFDPPVEESI